jgi:hypothetical protein
MKHLIFPCAFAFLCLEILAPAQEDKEVKLKPQDVPSAVWDGLWRCLDGGQKIGIVRESGSLL